MESGARLPTFYSLSSATLLRVFVGLCFKKQLFGAPAMVQWVKNLTAVARVAVEVWVQSLTQCSGLKDLALLQLWHRCSCGSDSYAAGAAIKKIHPNPTKKIAFLGWHIYQGKKCLTKGLSLHCCEPNNEVNFLPL